MVPEIEYLAPSPPGEETFPGPVGVPGPTEFADAYAPPPPAPAAVPCGENDPPELPQPEAGEAISIPPGCPPDPLTGPADPAPGP